LPLEQELKSRRERAEPIAIIGLGCRFPGGADAPEAYWRVLKEGVDAIRDVPAERWTAHLEALSPQERQAMGRAGLLDAVDGFDAGFFGISPREAVHLDPQQRLVLEVAWEALEHAGLPPDSLVESPTGVFLGISNLDYRDRLVERGPEWMDAYATTGNLLCTASGRVSYVLGLRGPALSVETGCSSALVALHLACQSLDRGETRVALAGGVNLILSALGSRMLARLGVLAPDGRCKTFDARANGFVRGEGCGVVVLKRLSDARREGDRIWALIPGSALNQDGRSAGMTMPDQQAQQALLARALENAGVLPSQVTYVEAHGTGTPVGDPIEVAALGAVLGPRRPEDPPCVLGSVKANLGHLESAAGIAGLMKVVLALEHELIPRQLHFETPNPKLALERSPFVIPVEARPWKAGGAPRFAGVSSFGLSGTNAHVILREAPRREGEEAGEPRAGERVLLPLSAKSPEALTALAGSFQEYLKGDAGKVSLGDVAYTASARRGHHRYRLAVVGSSREELARALAATSKAARAPRVETEEPPRVVFVFSGQGSQWLGMGRRLLDEPVFRRALEDCEAVLRPHTDWSLLEQLQAGAERSRLEAVDVVQPVLFALQVALARLWRWWGVEPAAVVGHSLGEVAAAHVAGVLTLEDAARVIAVRSRLVREQASGKGGMAVVELTAEEAARAIAGLEDRLAVGVYNGPRACVLSGESAALEAVLARLEADGVFRRRVKVDYASHSPQMEALGPLLREALAGLQPGPASVPFFSTVCAGWKAGTGLDADYWAANLREPVRFAQAVRALREQGHDVFLELSPHPVLVPVIEDGLRAVGRGGVALASLRREEEEREGLLTALGALYTRGLVPDWSRLYPRKGRVVTLPAYPWQRQRYWVEAAPMRAPGARVRPAGSHPLLGRAFHPSSQPGTRLWETVLSVKEVPWLADHRVREAVVLPGAAYLEMALAAAREAHGEEPQALEEVSFHHALTFPEGTAHTVQLALAEQGPGLMSFRVSSRTGGARDSGWTLHASGLLRGGPRKEAERGEPLESLRARAREELSGEECYRALTEWGLGYGPAFQGVRRVWRGEAEAVGQLHLPEPQALEEGGYVLHPALLDAAFQVLLAPLLGREGAGPAVPIHVRGLRFHGPPGTQTWSHARVRGGDEGTLEADVRLLDESGRVWVEVEGIRVRRLERGALRSQAEGSLLGVEWQRVELPPRRDVPRGRWLVLADGGGVGARVEVLLREQGASVRCVAPASSSFECFTALLKESLVDGEPPRGVVYLRGLDIAPGEEPLAARGLEATQELGGLGAMHLAQALVHLGARETPRLWLVTRGVQGLGAGPSTASVFQAPLWGLGRTLAYEHPELRCTQVDLGTGGFSGEARALVEELLAEDREAQVALREDGRYVARLVRRGLVDERPRLHVLAAGRPFRLEVEQAGSLDRLGLRAVERRAPGPGEVEIEVEATGLIFRDVLLALGVLPAEDPREGPMLGYECAGRVVAVGEGVMELHPGESVVALATRAFSSFVTADARLVLPRPSALSAEAAASLLLSHLTACHALAHVGRLSRGERVLIHAATGGVGLAALQWARHLGAEVYATAGSPEKREYLRSLGVRYVSDSRSPRFVEDVREWTGGEGVDVVLNSLAGEFIPRSLELLRDQGRFVELGMRDSLANATLGLRPFLNSLSFSLVDLRGMMKKRPEQVRRLLQEVLGLVEQGVLHAPPHRVLPISRAEEAFRTMAQGRHLGKLVLSMVDADARVEVRGEEGLKPGPEGTYLLSGGLGGLGLELARWLVEQGARHLVLLGRSGAATPAQAEAVARLEAAGARVRVARADVSRAEELRRVLDEVGASMPPLRGVVHAAGVLEDAMLEQQDRERWLKVLEPKAAGAWNLHVLTRGLPLDFFVLYSSVAGTVGSPGQSNYAAANTFLDALAGHRRAQGLPALSVAWGPIRDVGLAAAEAIRGHRLARQGMGWLSAEEGHGVLARLWGGGESHVAVVPFDARRWVEAHPHVVASPFLSSLLQHAGEARGGGGIREELDSAEPARRLPLLEHFLREQLSQVLRVEPERVDRRTPLRELGLDSLMGLELRNRLEASLGLTLSATLIWTHPHLAALAESLAGKLEALPGKPSGPTGPEPLRHEALRRMMAEGLVPPSAREEEALAARMRAELDALARSRAPSAERELSSLFRPLAVPRGWPMGGGAFPLSALEGTLARIQAGVLGRGPVGMHEDFFEGGGTLEGALHLVGEIQKQLSVSLPPHAPYVAPTVRALAGLVAGAAGADVKGRERWLQRWGTSPEPVIRLFCFAPGGAGASHHRSWERALPEHVEVLAFERPGREGLLFHPPLENLDALLDAMMEALEPLLDKPFVFYGHSLGARIAWALTRRLARSGKPLPLHLFAAASWAPHRERRLEDDARELTDELLLPFCRSFSGLSEESLGDSAWRETVLPLFRADVHLMRSVRHVEEAPLDVLISCLGGQEDAIVTPEDLREWRHLTTLPLRSRSFPGGHLFPQAERHAVLAFILETLGLPVPGTGEAERVTMTSKGESQSTHDRRK
jgi:acyl transferase domain-containing protein/surfactin synthase thioesterase subunit/acyl carrier protein